MEPENLGGKNWQNWNEKYTIQQELLELATLLLIIVRKRQNISKDIDLNTVNQLEIKEICRTLYPQTVKHLLFSSADGTFFRMDCKVGP